MINPFSFNGPIGRITYALWALPIFFAQYGAGWLAGHAQGVSISNYDVFYAFPLRLLFADQVGPKFGYASQFFSLPMTLGGLAFMLLACWTLAALTYRRALHARGGGWLAAAVLMPLLQLPVILVMCVVPPRQPSAEPLLDADRERKIAGWGGAAQGMIAGIALTLAAVALSALVFGAYGYGIFLASPFVVGGITGYLANRAVPLNDRETNRIVFRTGFFACLALMVTALEGIGCLIMAAPLAAFAAMLGGIVGGDAARRKRAGLVSSVAVLPIIFALEAAFPPSLVFGTEQTIAIAASPDRVWSAIVRMETIKEPIALIHHIGIAYPVRGRVFGEGVGALRYGDFSTGTAVERVTEWEVNRKLTFVVLRDIPGLRELSPYRHVHAPHVHGYFTTRETSFELIPRADGVTELVERTSHELRLDPALYWLPFARFMVDTNNARVLRHIKEQAERSMVASSPSP
ncbi:SRPBCC family protein [Pseudorhodoplanes sp.]|uniref:SRPBCC family protein n=1 Tax=Pseudorhodoplanes sp. TaxID=1934341 RepID=UPI003D0BD2E2